MSVRAWPLPFAAALSLFRASLRLMPPTVYKSDPIMRSVVQPIFNSVGWPSRLLVPGVTMRPGRVGGLRGEWFLPNQKFLPAKLNRLLLWVHGGGFSLCSPRTHRLFLAKLAACADIPVYCVDYRKPPDFTFPVPGHDIFNTYQALLEEDVVHNIFIGGDSAGGNLALATTRMLTQPDLLSYCPKGLILLSPWVDLSDITGESWQKFVDIDFVPLSHTQALAEIYASGNSLKDIRISPGLCEDWTSFPPTLLDYGGCEVLRTQIERLAMVMEREGVTINVDAAEGMVHAYPLLEFLWGHTSGLQVGQNSKPDG